MAKVTVDSRGTCFARPGDDGLLQWAETMAAYPAACQAVVNRQQALGQKTVEQAVLAERAAADVRMQEAKLEQWLWWEKALVVVGVVGAVILSAGAGYAVGNSAGVTVVK